jgi:hypothetical protein
MSVCDFLVGQTVCELRFRSEGVVFIVFEYGERAEPALYPKGSFVLVRGWLRDSP